MARSCGLDALAAPPSFPRASGVGRAAVASCWCVLRWRRGLHVRPGCSSPLWGALNHTHTPALTKSEIAERTPKAAVRLCGERSRGRATRPRPKTAWRRCLGLHENMRSRSRPRPRAGIGGALGQGTGLPAIVFTLGSIVGGLPPVVAGSSVRAAACRVVWCVLRRRAAPPAEWRSGDEPQKKPAVKGEVNASRP